MFCCSPIVRQRAEEQGYGATGLGVAAGLAAASLVKPVASTAIPRALSNSTAVVDSHSALQDYSEPVRSLFQTIKHSSIEDYKQPYMSFQSVLITWALLLFTAFASVKLELHLEASIIVSSIRCVVQLSFLGAILLPIFNAKNPLLVLCYMMFMSLLAALEAVARPAYTYDEMFLQVFCVMTGVQFLTCCYMLYAVLGVGIEAQFAIPIMGMLLGNSLSGVSLSTSTVVTELAEHRGTVEHALSLGASRWEATKELLVKSATLGLTPSINQISVAGVVAIPGMMTGQIIGGASPEQAARYQIVLLFLINASTTTAILAISSLAISTVVDGRHCFRNSLKPARKVRMSPSTLLNALRDWMVARMSTMFGSG
mmetsp:Transcript_4725/g.12203  ORF Transcript_4725/g.12203 Transcript_4725/m.12203 type:complete len:370 (+) Transcript_4725:326-1435(+)